MTTRYITFDVFDLIRTGVGTFDYECGLDNRGVYLFFIFIDFTNLFLLKIFIIILIKRMSIISTPFKKFSLRKSLFYYKRPNYNNNL